MAKIIKVHCNGPDKHINEVDLGKAMGPTIILQRELSLVETQPHERPAFSRELISQVVRALLRASAEIGRATAKPMLATPDTGPSEQPAVSASGRERLVLPCRFCVGKVIVTREMIEENL